MFVISLESFSSYEESLAVMPQRLIFGTVKGNLIHTLKTVVQEVINETIKEKEFIVLRYRIWSSIIIVFLHS